MVFVMVHKLLHFFQLLFDLSFEFESDPFDIVTEDVMKVLSLQGDFMQNCHIFLEQTVIVSFRTGTSLREQPINRFLC